MNIELINSVPNHCIFLFFFHCALDSFCFLLLSFYAYFIAKTTIGCDQGLPRMHYDAPSWQKYQKTLNAF